MRPAVVIGGACVPLAAIALVVSRTAAGAPDVSYARDIQPLLDRKCTVCHPVAYPYLDLRADRSYDQLVRTLAATNPAFERVVPYRPELSYLLTHPVDPSNLGLLTPGDRALLRRWILAGAPRS